MTDDTRATFAQAWPAPERADALHDEIAARMAGRAYHGFDHVRRLVTRRLEMAGACLPDVTAFIFFHDAVYDTLRTDNEERSADLFLACLGATTAACAGCAGAACPSCGALGRTFDAPAGVDRGFAMRVTATIVATGDHFGDHGPHVDAGCLDLDLSFLGEPWERFVADSAAIRTEWPHVPDDLFWPSRRKFLASVLARPTIYRTAPFRDRFEARARDNLTRAIADAPA